MGGMNKSNQSSQQQSQGSSRSFVDPSQVPFLNNLRQQGQQLANAQIPVIGGVADQLSGRLGGIGDQFLGGLQNAAQSFAPGALDSISNLIGFGTGQGIGQGQLADLAGGGGRMNLESLLQPGAMMGGQLDALDQAIQRNLASTLGTVGSQATLQGQTGGDRQAFFAGEAAGEAQRAFAGGAADLMGADLQQRRGLAAQLEQLNLNTQLGAAGQLAQQGLSGLQAGGNLGLAQQAGQTQAGLGGLSALSGLFNLGMSPFGAQFAPLQSLAGIIGGPTVLSEQQQTSSGRGSGSSFGLSLG